MSDNKIETIVNSSTSFGKYNAILYFKAPWVSFEEIYNDIINLFNPDQVKCSLFDLAKMEMNEVRISELSNQNNNSILRILLVKEKEELILEYYKNQVIIEHLFRANDLVSVNGCSLIEKYHTRNINSILVMGFELSINVDSYESSLMENISDKSLHPIFIVKRINGNQLVEEYVSDNGDVNDQKVEIMRQYLKGLGNPCH